MTTWSGFVVRPAAEGDAGAAVAVVRDVLAEFGMRFGEGAATDAELANLPPSYADRGGAFWVAVGSKGIVGLSVQDTDARPRVTNRARARS